MPWLFRSSRPRARPSTNSLSSTALAIGCCAPFTTSHCDSPLACSNRTLPQTRDRGARGTGIPSQSPSGVSLSPTTAIRRPTALELEREATTYVRAHRERSPRKPARSTTPRQGSRLTPRSFNAGRQPSAVHGEEALAARPAPRVLCFGTPGFERASCAASAGHARFVCFAARRPAMDVSQVANLDRGHLNRCWTH
ncbi:hypothetical protein C8Q79DRAFT_364265 [Trametes meyenii]|nr:hypothetical protein C8Q79DRAFT_364265 [Trametes meyenii]